MSRRAVRFILLAASSHAVLTVALILLSFGQGMAQFDGRSEPTWLDSATSNLLDILSWPVLTAAMRWSKPGWFSGFRGYIPIVVNSLVWGLAVWGLARGLRGLVRTAGR